MPEADQAIADKLKAYAAQGVSFYDAKQQLQQDGYSEEAIQLASDNYQYGSVPPPPDPAMEAFKKDPTDTEKIGEDILKDDKSRREEQAIVDGIAADAGPDIQSEVKYQNNYLHDIGMSWWTWLIIEGGLVGAFLYFHLPQFLYSIVVIILVIVLAVKRA